MAKKKNAENVTSPEKSDEVFLIEIEQDQYFYTATDGRPLEHCLKKGVYSVSAEVLQQYKDQRVEFRSIG